jgi:hypothetical protein
MSKPVRIQRKRTEGWRMPANTVYVGRGSKYGNPFNQTQIAVCFLHKGTPAPLIPLKVPPSPARCLDMYVAHLHTVLKSDPGFLDSLRGRNLACWCPLDKPCHADILLRLANE